MKYVLLRALAAGLSLAVLAGTAQAEDDPHIRGKITAIEGATYSVESASGQLIEVKLADDATVLLYTPLELSDVKPDDYLGIPSAPLADGGKRALAVIVFPAAMRGINEGDSAWDLVPGSRMTNATLAEVTANDGTGRLSVSYGDESEEIVVPAGTPVVTFATAPGRKIVVGEQAIFFAQQVDGAYTAGLVGVSEDGSLPPL
ncbi:MAG: hypothetical protein HC844_06905 [Tabrizicola sp.]|nr:hypothetical protein [Tabrizicola sp.]